MRIKVYFNKNLKLSEGKLSAQVAHAVSGLLNTTNTSYDNQSRIVVLGLRQTQFNALFNKLDCPKYQQVDLGLTEIEQGTATAFAYFEEE